MRTSPHGGLVPQAAVSNRSKGSFLFDHLVGAGEQHRRHGKAERLGSFEIDREPGPRGLLDRQVGRFVALKNPAGI
jgi:hypothetical protein